MRLFVAQTLDGYLAGEDDSLDHLLPFQQNDYGYESMLAEVDAVIVGRRTLDRIHPSYGWPYPARLHGVVLTRRPLPAGLPANVVGVADPAAIASRWPGAFVDGGGRAIGAFLALGAVRRATLFTLPVRLGRGVRLFPERAPGCERWELVDVRRFPCGTVAADYRIPSAKRLRSAEPPGPTAQIRAP